MNHEAEATCYPIVLPKSESTSNPLKINHRFLMNQNERGNFFVLLCI